MKLIQFFLISVFIISCNSEKYFSGPNNYEDDFESYSTYNDLLEDKDKNWSFAQLTNPDNTIYIDSTFSFTGIKSTRFEARQSSNGTISKCSIVKQKMSFWSGETVRIEAWYYIEGNQFLEWLFLMDLEEQTTVGAGPGMRLALVKEKLRIEYKFYEDDVVQLLENELLFPRNEWVGIVWEVGLSESNKGTIKLWQNDTLIIDCKKKRTLPKDFLYFQQGTKGMYSSIEIGITANSENSNLRLWIDDFSIEVIN